MILSPNWLIESPIDFEYKQYLILAFEQTCNSEYQKLNLFPALYDANSQYKYVSSFLQNKNKIESDHKQIKRIDFDNSKVEYQTKIKDESILIFSDIAEWSQDIFKSVITNGKYLYDKIERQIEIELIKKEKNNFGYLIFNSKPSLLFHYSLNKMIYNLEDHWGVHVEFIREIESKKLLTNISQDQPIWNVFYPTDLSVDSTILPIVKRMIMKKHLDLI